MNPKDLKTFTLDWLHFVEKWASHSAWLVDYLWQTDRPDVSDHQTKA